MNIQSYITSGVLEAYLMGELTPAEMEKVDLVAVKYPEVAEELLHLREALNEYAEGTGMTPDRNILASAMAEIEVEEELELSRNLAASENLLQQSINKPTYAAWKVAATVLLLLSGGLNYYLFTKWKDVEESRRALTSERAELANQVNVSNETLEMQEQELEYANLRITHFLSEDNIHVRMDGMDISPSSFANVFWNKKTNAVYISVDNLPDPPHGHQYQLWAIKPGKAPIDAGIFDHSKMVQELKTIRGNVAAFAVTLEKEGGVANATVEKTYVKGFLKKT